MSNLQRCFEGVKNVPKRLKEVPENLPNAEQHIQRAESNIRAASIMAENKFFDWCITCSYYAMYHATMASLWLIGLEARSHECAIEAFESFYVKKEATEKKHLIYVKRAKTLSDKYINSLESAKAERIKASYGLGEINSQEASRTLSEAREFVDEITRIIYEAKGIEYKTIK